MVILTLLLELTFLRGKRANKTRCARSACQSVLWGAREGKVTGSDGRLGCGRLEGVGG